MELKIGGQVSCDSVQATFSVFARNGLETRLLQSGFQILPIIILLLLPDVSLIIVIVMNTSYNIRFAHVFKLPHDQWRIQKVMQTRALDRHNLASYRGGLRNLFSSYSYTYAYSYPCNDNIVICRPGHTILLHQIDHNPLVALQTS